MNYFGGNVIKGQLKIIQPLLHVLLAEKTPRAVSSVVFSANNTFNIGYHPLQKKMSTKCCCNI